MNKEHVNGRKPAGGEYPLALFPAVERTTVKDGRLLHGKKLRLPLHTRRSHPRIYKREPVRFSISGSTDFQKAVLCNESTGGICLETDFPLLPGTVIHVVVEASGMGSSPLKHKERDAEVRWCRRIGRYPKRFAVGARFYKNITA